VSLKLSFQYGKRRFFRKVFLPFASSNQQTVVFNRCELYLNFASYQEYLASLGQLDCFKHNWGLLHSSLFFPPQKRCNKNVLVSTLHQIVYASNVTNICFYHHWLKKAYNLLPNE
jgi:hypothetical protein